MRQHYTTKHIKDLDDIRWFKAPNELNWLFLSTSGVHGTYCDVEDLRRYFKDPSAFNRDENAGEEYEPAITVLIVKPRMVQCLYGHFVVTPEDLDWLERMAKETAVVIAGRTGVVARLGEVDP